MIKKSLFGGIWLGLLLTLALLYPAFYLFVFPVLPARSNPLELWLGYLHIGSFNVAYAQLLLLLNAGVIPILLVLVGSVPALRGQARDLRSGLLMGLASGFSAGMVLYLFLVAPTHSVAAGYDLFNYPLSMTRPTYPEAMLVAYVRETVLNAPSNLLATVGFFSLMGGLMGGLVGALRRKVLPTQPKKTLLEMPLSPLGRRAWFSGSEEAVLVAVVVGLVFGFLLVFASLNMEAKNSTDPADMGFSVVVQKAVVGTPANALVNTVVAEVLSPIIYVLILFIGGFAAFLLRNPSNRVAPRVYAAALAGMVAAAVYAAVTTGSIRLGLVLMGQFPFQNLAEWSEITQQGLDVNLAMDLVRSPVFRVALIYLFPLGPILGIVLSGAGIGALEGLLAAGLLSTFHWRPADRAEQLRREVLQHPEQVLLRIYRLFQQDCSATRILEHLYFNLRTDPDRAALVGAYHALALTPSDASAALKETTRILGQHPEWKLSPEVAALHSILLQGAQALTVSQVAAVQPMPEDQTSSLLPPLAKAGENLSRVLNELKKVQRVDDLNTKIIFLNNSLEALRVARLYIENTVRQGLCYPEFAVLHVLLDRWDSMVLLAVKDLQGSADLLMELKTRKLTGARQQQVLTVSLVNQGLNVAENLRLHFADGEGSYQVLEGRDQVLEILPPKESRELSVSIRCEQNQPFRFAWQLIYDDALAAGRQLDFADQVEFVREEKPFQRIFPIPYVTGTPLQTGQMFVGRQDVFDFVRENLFGAYQNNVIVLHGQRRTGKSSILYHLNEVLAESHFCVLVDMQGKAARGEADFLYSIADDIVYALENHDIHADLPPRQDFDDSPEFYFRSRFLRSLYPLLGEKNLLLMFDEFEELQKRVEDGKLNADIFPYLRNLMQHERKVDFVFAGTHKLEELASEYWSILFNIAAYKRITFLDFGDVTRLVCDPVRPYGMEYDPLTIERIYQVASGHPYFTQVVCHEMVAYHNETQRSYLTVTDIDAVLERIIERGEAHFKYIWAESSTGQRLTLLALAELLEVGEKVTPEDLRAHLEKRGRPITVEDLRQALGALEARDIIGRADPRSNLYRFRVDLIRRWIYATRPAYEKVI